MPQALNPFYYSNMGSYGIILLGLRMDHNNLLSLYFIPRGR